MSTEDELRDPSNPLTHLLLYLLSLEPSILHHLNMALLTPSSQKLLENLGPLARVLHVIIGSCEKNKAPE